MGIMGKAWLVLIGSEAETRLDRSQTRLSAQRCHLGQGTNREARVEWICLFILATVHPARQRAWSRNRGRQRRMRALGRHPGHDWKGLEKQRLWRMEGGRERRTGSWFERDNDVSPSNNGDGRIAAVVWPLNKGECVKMVRCLFVRKLSQLKLWSINQDSVCWALMLSLFHSIILPLVQVGVEHEASSTHWQEMSF